MIEALAFDIGGVLVTNPLGEFAKVDAEYGLREATTMGCFRGGSLFAQCETGVLPFADFCVGAVAEIEADQGIRVPADRLAQMMSAVMGGAVEAGMLALMAQCKERGLRIALVSNIYRELAPWVATSFPTDLVDLNCSSYVVGQRKPEAGIFLELIARLDLPPSRIVFIDDFPENIAAAARLGIHGVLFTDEQQCRAALRELGVDLTP
ncbi:MAG: HAD family hydrolase [Sporichthyaceae bacterium]